MARLKGCLFLVVGFLILYMFVTFGGKSNEAALPTLAVLAQPTSRPDVRPSATVASEVTIIPTVVARSGFVTITPAPGTVYPTATITDTAQPTVTNTDAPSETPVPQITPIDNEIYYVVSTVNLRSCPHTDCPVVEKIASGLPLAVSGVVQGESVDAGNPNWYRVEHSAASEEYAYSRFLSSSPTIKTQPQQNVPQQQQVASPIPQAGFVCPSNCTDAVAMGLSPEQAATCPNLDRNHNGVACYGS